MYFLYTFSQIADFADYSNVVVDYAVNYIAPMVRGNISLDCNLDL